MPITPRFSAKPLEESVMTCDKCGNTWLELITVQHYSDVDLVGAGQRPVPKGEVAFYLYRCVKCMKLHEPPTNISPHDSIRKSYDKMLDDLSTPAVNKVTGEKL
jgi:hypothetical protein